MLHRNTNRSLHLRWALSFLSVLLASCASSTSWDDLKIKYSSMEQHKAFAGSYNGVTYASWNYPSVEEAIESALKSCADRGGDGCHILDVNDNPYDPSAETRNEKSKQSQLSLTPKYSDTQDIYTKYYAGTHHKAFASSSNGPYGAAWNHASVEAAMEAALGYCTKAGGYECQILHVNDNPYDPSENERYKATERSHIVTETDLTYEQQINQTGREQQAMDKSLDNAAHYFGYFFGCALGGGCGGYTQPSKSGSENKRLPTGYKTRDAFGNIVDSNSQYKTRDALGNIVNSTDRYNAIDMFGNYRDSRSTYKTRDANGNIVTRNPQ